MKLFNKKLFRRVLISTAVIVALWFYQSFQSLPKSPNPLCDDSNQSNSSVFVFRMESNLPSKKLASLKKSLHQYDFALVIPWQADWFSFEPYLYQLGPLIGVMAARGDLVAISGAHRKFPNWSLCTLRRVDPISIQLNQTAAKVGSCCFLCDVLPDVFVMLSSFLLGNLRTVIRYGASASLGLFLNASGRSVLCPDFDMTSKGLSTSQDFTCNGLPIFFDGRFALYPELDIWRLLVQEEEFWLGCVWSKTSVDSGLPIACHNWNRELLFDIADVFQENFPTIGFQVGYGVLLGAVRQKRIIPWSYDIDLILKLNQSHYRHFADTDWHNLPKFSRWRYSHKDRNGSKKNLGGNLARAFPSCPKRFPGNRMEPIEPIISEIQSGGGKKSSFDKDYLSVQATGFLDLFPFNMSFKNLDRCNGKLGVQMGDADGSVEIGGRQFPAPFRAAEVVQCIYGRNWKDLPGCAKKNWKTFC